MLVLITLEIPTRVSQMRLRPKFIVKFIVYRLGIGFLEILSVIQPLSTQPYGKSINHPATKILVDFLRL